MSLQHVTRITSGQATPVHVCKVGLETFHFLVDIIFFTKLAILCKKNIMRIQCFHV